MLKFIWGRGQGPTAERVKLQKELFNFSKNVTYGFPSKPGDVLFIFGRNEKSECRKFSCAVLFVNSLFMRV